MSTEEYFDDEVNAENCAEGGLDIPAPGRYHVEVADYQFKAEKSEHVFTFIVHAGQPSKKDAGDQRGKQIRLWVTTEHKEYPRKFRAQLSLVLGLITKEQANAARESGQPVVINWEDSVGRHCGIICIEDEYNGKTKTKIKWPNDIFKLDAREAVGMPIDKAALAGAGRDDPFADAANMKPVAAEATKPAAASLFG